MRLGQHFTNQTVACTNDTDITDCTEPRIDIEVIEEIHREKVSNAWHNFALLRLAKRVTFTGKLFYIKFCKAMIRKLIKIYVY